MKAVVTSWRNCASYHGSSAHVPQHFTTTPHILRDQAGEDAFSPAALDEQNQIPTPAEPSYDHISPVLQMSVGLPYAAPLKKEVCCRGWGGPGLPQIWFLDSKLQESSGVYVVHSSLTPGQCTLAGTRPVVNKICEMNR